MNATGKTRGRTGRIFKRIMLGLAILLILLAIFILSVIAIDASQTSYLDVDNYPKADLKSRLIINANVIPMTSDTILRNQMVLIEDGTIVKIADVIDTTGRTVFDAEQHYLTPGLVDMHVHVWDKYELGLYLSYGVTSIRNLWGRPEHLRIKMEVTNDEIFSPLFFTTSPKLTGPDYQTDDNVQLQSADGAMAKVASYKDRGYDFIKTYYGLTPELFDAVIEQAKISGVDVVAHPTAEVPYAYHFNPQIASIEHAEDIVQQPLNYKLDTAALVEVVDQYAASPHTSFSPTLVVYYNIYRMLTEDDILTSDEIRMINPTIRKTDSKAQFDRWQGTKASNRDITEAIKAQHNFQVAIIKKMHDAGVNIICSTDAGIGVTPAGVSIHRELAFYKEAGLTNYEVLKTATANTAKVHDIMNNTGTIEPGNIANLLLLDESPLEDLNALQNPSYVFIKGRMLDRPTLDQFEDKALNRKNFLATALRYLEYFIVEK